MDNDKIPLLIDQCFEIYEEWARNSLNTEYSSILHNRLFNTLLEIDRERTEFVFTSAMKERNREHI